MKILILDNYDSFTFNLVHLIESVSGIKPDVFRNDAISLVEIEKYDAILLSPGPGLPSESGILMDVIRQFHNRKPILGVCLGHQAIGEFFGAKLQNLKKVLHGVSTEMTVLKKDDELYKNVPEKFKGGHYHSWVIDRSSIPRDLCITVEDHFGNIMGISHLKYPINGIQFHPESVLTNYGETLMNNWIKSISTS